MGFQHLDSSPFCLVLQTKPNMDVCWVNRAIKGNFLLHAPSQKGLEPKCQKPIGRLRFSGNIISGSFTMKIYHSLYSIWIYPTALFNYFYLKVQRLFLIHLLWLHPPWSPLFFWLRSYHLPQQGCSTSLTILSLSFPTIACAKGSIILSMCSLASSQAMVGKPFQVEILGPLFWLKVCIP